MDKWWRNAVVYQVYPRSFQDSNGDGIGDLPGITSRLEYLKELGIDVLWLSPIYESPQVDNGYDISDYQAINPDYGTLDDFDHLVEKAHSLGIKILMDLVVNHTSDQHEWFKKAISEPTSKYRDYYIFRDAQENGDLPNNWGDFFGGCAWQKDEASGQYYLHLYAPQQPDLNWENPQVRRSIYDMMNWWVARGVDGFRMDVINEISKPHDLPNGKKNPGEKYADPGQLVNNGPRVHEYLQEMNQNVLSRASLMSVGETPGVTCQEALRYANVDGTELTMVFEFEHMALDGNPNPALGRWYDGKAKLSDLRSNFTKWQTGLAGKAWNSLYWNNHDQPRVVSRFGDDSSEETRVKSATMLATMLHMLQGTPFIYEGEELGMTNMPFTELSQFEDIDSLNAYHLIVEEEKLASPEAMITYLAHHSRDNARTPMQWDSSTNAGFTTGTPWYGVNPNYVHINAEQAMKDPHSVFHYYQKLISLRHHVDAVVNGAYALYPGNENDEQVYAYTRTTASEQLLVVLNYTGKELQRDITVGSNAKLVLSNYDGDNLEQNQGEIVLKPYEARVYLTQL